jgi:hypothetical protein
MGRLAVLSFCAAFLAAVACVTLWAQQVVPSGIPQQAFAALQKAKQWRQDAILVMVEINDYNGTGNFAVKFSFYSPSNGTGLWVIQMGGGSGTVAQAGVVNWGTQPIPMFFLDLPAAVQQARARGLQGKMDHAMLQVTSSGMNWEIAPVFDPQLRTFAINANLGPSRSGPSPQRPGSDSPSSFGSLPGSDSLIVPGQRIGPVSLGMTTVNALKALNQQSETCHSDLLNHQGNENIFGGYSPVISIVPGPAPQLNGVDPGFTYCEFEHWGISINFLGDPNSSQGGRKAVWIGASPDAGNLSRRYATDRGIRIGSSDQDVWKAYGNVEKKLGDAQDISLSYPKLGIEFTLGGSGPNGQKLPGNIVEKISVTKP